MAYKRKTTYALKPHSFHSDHL